jgi:hypothetical protein
MEDELKLNIRQITITGGRTMNIYTFDLDGQPMPEMKKEDIVDTLLPEPAQ